MSKYPVPDYLAGFLSLFIAVMLSGSHAYAQNNIAEAHYAKPHAPVDIQYALEELSPENHRVKLVFENKIDVNDLVVSVKLSDGLQSSELLPEYNFGVLAKHSLSKINFNVSSVVDGRYRIYIFAKLLNSGVDQQRSFIVPVTTGKPSAVIRKSNSNVKTDSTGKRIISMPATAASK